VFSRQIEGHVGAGDLLIGSARRSIAETFLERRAGRASKGSRVVTFSGFREDNPLRQTGDIKLLRPCPGNMGSSSSRFNRLLHAMRVRGQGLETEQRGAATPAVSEDGRSME